MSRFQRLNLFQDQKFRSAGLQCFDVLYEHGLRARWSTAAELGLLHLSSCQHSAVTAHPPVTNPDSPNCKRKFMVFKCGIMRAWHIFHIVFSNDKSRMLSFESGKRKTISVSFQSCDSVTRFWSVVTLLIWAKYTLFLFLKFTLSPTLNTYSHLCKSHFLKNGTKLDYFGFLEQKHSNFYRNTENDAMFWLWFSIETRHSFAAILSYNVFIIM